jgi:hypothetical protein
VDQISPNGETGSSNDPVNIVRMLQDGWASAVFEVLADNNFLVVLEGLNVMQEFHFAFKRQNLQDYFKLHLKRMLGQMPTASADLKTAYARLQGKFLDRLAS